MEINNFWVDIENASGKKLGKGPLRPAEFHCTKLLSASGEFSFTVSVNDPNLASLAIKRIAFCRYIDKSGAVQTFGGGVIDRIETAIDENGQTTLQVSGNDLTRELTYRSVGALKLESGGEGVTNGPGQIMALAPAGWSITGGATAEKVYAGFDGESVLSALIRVGEHVGEHWRLGSGRQIIWLGTADQFADCGWRAVQHVNDPVSAELSSGVAVITSLQEVHDAAELLTRVIPRDQATAAPL